MRAARVLPRFSARAVRALRMARCNATMLHRCMRAVREDVRPLAQGWGPTLLNFFPVVRAAHALGLPDVRQPFGCRAVRHAIAIFMAYMVIACIVMALVFMAHMVIA